MRTRVRGRERGREDIGHHANTVICKEVLSCSYWSSSVRNNRLRGRGSRSLAIGRIVFLEFFTGFPGVTRGGVSTLAHQIQLLPVTGEVFPDRGRLYCFLSLVILYSLPLT